MGLGGSCDASMEEDVSTYKNRLIDPLFVCLLIVTCLFVVRMSYGDRYGLWSQLGLHFSKPDLYTTLWDELHR